MTLSVTVSRTRSETVSPPAAVTVAVPCHAPADTRSGMLTPAQSAWMSPSRTVTRRAKRRPSQSTPPVLNELKLSAGMVSPFGPESAEKARVTESRSRRAHTPTWKA